MERQRTSRPSREQLEAALAAQRNGVPLRPDDLYRTAKQTVFTEHAPAPIPEAAEADASLEAALEASIAAHEAERAEADRRDAS